MTAHAIFPPVRQHSAATARPALIVPLSTSRSAVFFDADRAQLSMRDRLAIDFEGLPVKGPVAMTRLTLIGGGERHVCLLPLSAHELCRRTLTLRSGATVRAAIDPSLLQSPLTDLFALLANLDGTGGLRLLRLLLTTGTRLFDTAGIEGFGGLVDHLVETAGGRLPLLSRSPVGRRAWILSWRIPVDLALPPLDSVILLAGGRTQRIGGVVATEEVVDGRRLLHLLVPRPVPNEAEFLALGAMLLRLGLTAAVAPRALGPWLAGRDGRVRAKALAFVERLSTSDPDVAILKAELSCPPGAEPAAKALHLSLSPAGLLYAVGLDDPSGLLSAVRVRTEHDHVDLQCDRPEWHARHGSVVVGFVPNATLCVGTATTAPLYRSGRIGSAAPTTIAAASGLLPDFFRHLPVDVAAPLLARSVPSAMATRPVWRHRLVEFGPMPCAPTIAVVVGAGSAPEYVYAVVASVVAEAGGRGVEIVLYHRDGPATEIVRGAAETMSAIHRVGLRVVSIAPRAEPSECLRSALGVLRASRAIVIGPESLPARRGWLSSWRRRIATDPTPRVIVAESGRRGVGEAGGYVAGLGTAAIAALTSCRPVLPGILTDIRATATLAVVDRREDGIASYQDRTPDDLLRAFEVCVVGRTAGRRHV